MLIQYPNRKTQLMFRTMPLWQKILGALILGLIAGVLLGDSAMILKPIGDLFIRLMTMVIAPLIATMLFTAIVSLDDLSKLGKFGGRTVFLFLGTTVISVCIGIFFSEIFSPGSDAQGLFSELLDGEETLMPANVSFLDRLFGLVPTNPFAAFAEANLIQIIFFMLLLAIAALKVGAPAKGFVEMMRAATRIMHTLVGFIIELAPIGVFAIMAWLAGTFGLTSALPLLKLVYVMHIAVMMAMLFQYALVKAFSRISVTRFAKAIIEAQMLGYATCSSSATLPVTERCLIEKLGLPKRIVDFVLPIGAVCNMNGSAVYHTMAALFVAHAIGIDFALSDYLSLVFVVVVASVSAATVPGGGIVTASFVLSSTGLPIAAVGLIATIDRLLDGPRTAVNITGDCVAAVMLTKLDDTAPNTATSANAERPNP